MDYLKYCSLYFSKTKKILINKNMNNIVTLQYWSLLNEKLYVFGINYVIEIIKEYLKKNNYKNVKISYLKDGSEIKKFMPVLQIECELWKIIELENIICGILAQASSIYTKAKKILSITQKPIIFMGERTMHYINQSFIGYVLYNAGIRLFTTYAETEYIKNFTDYKILGTMPHALIAIFNGNIVKASKHYLNQFQNENLICLVDYSNDVIRDSLLVLNEFKEKLYAVRVDTSPKLLDNCFANTKPSKINFGVCPNLIRKLRNKLDENNGKHVKIIISSGVDYKKIGDFLKSYCEPDYYGIGSYFIQKIDANFSCDVVKNNNKNESKYGRKFVKFNFNETIYI